MSVPEEQRQAMRDLEASAISQPENLQLWKQLAAMQYGAGQIEGSYLEKAEASLLHVLDRDANDLTALRGLGNVAFDRGRPEEAVKQYSRYLAIKSDDLNVQTDLGTMLLASGQSEEAIATYQKVLAQEPKFFQAQFNLAIAYQRIGKTPEAIAALRKARDLATDDKARGQIDHIVEHLQGTPTAGTTPVSTSTGTALRSVMEGFFRAHQVMGPKIDRFEWQGDNLLRVVLNGFPVATIPEFARDQLNNRIRSQIKEQKAAHQITSTFQVDLVDGATNEVMESISE